MANIINGTDTGSGGLITTGDSSDELQIQTAETTAITVDSGQRTKFPTTIGVGGATPSTSGISFPATQSASTNANTLDDYEEGTWTPNITSSGGGSGSGADKAGTYTKIGRMVYASGYHVLTNKTGINAGQVRVEGLPFNSAGVWVGGVTFNTLNSIVQTGVQTNGGVSSNFISLANVLNNGTQTAINVTELTNTSGIYFSVFYQV
jgi:hypothetical protein